MCPTDFIQPTKDEHPEVSFIEFENKLIATNGLLKVSVNDSRTLYGIINAIRYELWQSGNDAWLEKQGTKKTLEAIENIFESFEFINIKQVEEDK